MAHSSESDSDLADASPGEARAAVLVGCIDGSVSPSDRSAVAIAVTGFRDVVASSPGGDEAALRYALGAGCRALQTPLAKYTAQVYLVGRGGAGPDGELAAARLATARGAALVLDVLTVEWADANLLVVRDLGRGARECLTLAGPAVLMVADDAPQPTYVSRHRQRSVQLPSGLWSDSTASPVAWEPVRLRPKTAELSSRTNRAARSRMFDAFGLNDESPGDKQHIVNGDAQNCAAHLVRYLAHHGFVDGRFAAVEHAAEETAPAQESSPGGLDSHTIAATPTARVPRSLQRETTGWQRRPRRYSQMPQRGMKRLSRGPRPLLGDRSAGRRGPFALVKPMGSIDG